MGKVVTRFPTKRRKSPTLWGSTYLHGLCEGVPPGKINYSLLFDPQPRVFFLSLLQTALVMTVPIAHVSGMCLTSMPLQLNSKSTKTD